MILLYFIYLPSLFHRSLAVVPTNSAGFIFPQKMTIFHTVNPTSKQNIAFGQNFLSHLKSFHYVKLLPGLVSLNR